MLYGLLASDLSTFGHFRLDNCLLKYQNAEIFNLQWCCFIDFPSDVCMCRGDFCFLLQWVAVHAKYKKLDGLVTQFSIFGLLAQSAICLGEKNGCWAMTDFVTMQSKTWGRVQKGILLCIKDYIGEQDCDFIHVSCQGRNATKSEQLRDCSTIKDKIIS